ncbi:MAG: hypothetical protein A4E57_02038 [Syntrophorhabdaceae bacterium PtaU1.Bin034]|jgi:SAM-dependent methyltransferase|nr:MAG: hypothetical protein A4E57_02038 [Syntrophorhabdaceae bacterium PtaU1.Bin034]
MGALLPHLAQVKGSVLDVGAKDAPYRQLVAHSEYTTLDISVTENPDICCDLHDISIKSDVFDAVIALEVLEHLYDPQRMINEMHRILKKDGIVIASTRFICRYHPDPNDYYRFTSDSLKHLFSRFSETSVLPHGNGLHAIWHIINNDYRPFRILLNPLNPLISRIDFESPGFPLGYIIKAVK